MRAKFQLTIVFFFFFLLGLPAFSQSDSSIKELKEQYNLFNKIANNSDIFWVVQTDHNEFDRDLSHGLDPVFARGKFVNRSEFEAFIGLILVRNPEITLEEKVNLMTGHINASKKIKEKLRNKVLPDLEKLIKKRENSVNHNTNASSYNPSNSSSFDSVLENMTSSEHLDSLNFDKILAQNSGGGTAIQNNRRDSFDGNWNDAINDNYTSCPKIKPDNRSSFRAYPNGQTSGNTYRECAYFKSGDLKLETSFLNGKQEGLRTEYSWSSKFNFAHVSYRTNYSNGKRNGLMEHYALTKNGAVYRKWFTTYSDGKQHGDGAEWYENGQTRKETTYFQGKPVLQYNYRKDGTFTYCTKWDADRTVRDCKTGKRR
ncbi:MAG: hypothetical protein HKP55_08930 [Gammaproteobacteria bacterium]|nr:hypothetical protein [Gammaproteobacteria bacterium]